VLKRRLITRKVLKRYPIMRARAFRQNLMSRFKKLSTNQKEGLKKIKRETI
jgi:hypothetical protein